VLLETEFPEEVTMKSLKITALTVSIGVVAIVGCGNGGSGDMSADEHAERMAVEHADDAPVANPMSMPADELQSVGETVVYATIDGEPVEGFLARPPRWAPGGPALIVIHEWWGLNDNIETMARRLADEGFLSLAVDLYGGVTADDPDRARELMQAVNEDSSLANLEQAFGFLVDTERAGEVGAIGWCFGGSWSLRTGIQMPDELDAVVIYYGRLTTDPELLATLEMPILGHFGEADQGIPIDQVRLFDAALAEVGADATIHVYEGAGHAFANPSGRNYEEAAAQASWQRTVAFLKQSLDE
jgi:carboxymethylenebutenolidase